MSEKSIVPQALEPFNAYILLVLQYLIDNASRLIVSDGNITSITFMVTDPATGWNHWHTLHSGATTRTGPVNVYLHNSETNITHQLQIIYNDIPRSVMTPDDYLTLHIAIPTNHRAPRTAITNIPFAKVYSVGGGIVNFIVRTDTHAKRAAMDPLADAVEVRGILLAPDEAVPTDPSKCDLVFNSKSALFSHAFTPENAGKKFACFLRFINLTDESKDGGWSGVISCIIGL
jgi:hypothetical protein